MLYFVYSFISDHVAINNLSAIILQIKEVQSKTENNDIKKVHIKNRTCYYFDDIIKLEDFDLDNILNVH